MKRYLGIFLLISIHITAFSQDVIINGINKNRLLTWEDFTGKPDKTSPHDANTHWNLNYSFKNISFQGDTVKTKIFLTTLELNPKSSWVKQDKQTDNLLKHEQGHFDIGVLCQLELIKQFNNAVFLKSDFQDKVKKIFDSVLNKYLAMGMKYDEETDHSKDQNDQDTWNSFFAKALNR